MNKTLAYALGIAFVIVGLGGILYLSIERPEATASFTTTVVLLFGLVSTYFVTVNGNAKIGERLERVETNTNGRLHAKDAEVAELQRKLLAAGIDPQTGEPVTDSIGVQHDPQQPG